jgi:hypothetical protein
MPQPIYRTFRRRINGPRRSRVRLGPRPLIFFVALIVISAVIGMKINAGIEDAEHQRVALQRHR